MFEYEIHMSKNEDKWNKTICTIKYKNDSYDFCFKTRMALSIAYTPSSEDEPPPSRALCYPNIKQNVDDVMHRRPKPIEHAVTAKNTALRMCSSEPYAAFIAPKVKPRIITQNVTRDE